MGTSLSGGQKQRIIVARALYRKPVILFMDEATSHLDINNESRLTHHLNRLKITRIIVAHRIETIASADRVFELVEGRLQQVAINDLINIHPHTSMEGKIL
jgi:ATP-binding cassette subfamily B protein RaxB